MQKQTNNKKQTLAQNKGDKTMKASKQAEQNKQTLVEKVIEQITEQAKQDKNIRMQKVTGYISVKYGNKVLFELHAKKKSITHLTFSDKQKAYEILEKNKLVHRVVPASYGWKYNTECFLTEDLYKQFAKILKSVIDEAVAERNLKEQASKKAEKKVAKA